MTENTDKIYKLLTTLGKIFDIKTFDIHRDAIAKLIHVDNRIVTQCMRSLKETHHVIDFTLSDDKEYTVTLLKQCKGRLFLICEGCTKEDFERLNRCCLEHYRKEQQERIEENDKRIQDLQGLNKTLQEANKTLQDLIEEYKRLKGENKRLQDLLDVKTSQLSEAKYSISELNAILDDEEEHNSLFNAKERQKEVRDEMVRECFLLSKKD